MSEREISKCEHKRSNNFCKKCGSYLFLDDKTLKTQYFESFLNCSPQRYLKHMRKRQSSITDVKQVNQSTALLVDAICEKFEYGIQTRALGMYIYAKACQKQESNQKFWVASALMIASKGIQLDKRVPYLNRYQRYADKSFPQEDYELAEKVIFSAMNFDVQYSTFISFLNFYMTTGMLFESDNLTQIEVKAIEDGLMLRAKGLIRHGAFLAYDPEKLAVSLIKQVRAKFQLTPWKQCLQKLSGISSDQIHAYETEVEALKPISCYQNIDKINSLSKNSYSSYNLQQKSSVLSSIQNLPARDHESKLLKTKKRHFENTLKIQNNQIKENYSKENAIRLHQQPLSSTLRQPNYSLSKLSFSSSTDRILPFNMFASRR